MIGWAMAHLAHPAKPALPSTTYLPQVLLLQNDDITAEA